MLLLRTSKLEYPACIYLRGSPELHSWIQMPSATVLGKTILNEKSNHFSILKRKTPLAVLQRFWGSGKWLAVGGMGLRPQLPCGPCPRGPTQGPHESASFIKGVSKSCPSITSVQWQHLGVGDMERTEIMMITGVLTMYYFTTIVRVRA